MGTSGKVRPGRWEHKAHRCAVAKAKSECNMPPGVGEGGRAGKGWVAWGTGKG